MTPSLLEHVIRWSLKQMFYFPLSTFLRACLSQKQNQLNWILLFLRPSLFFNVNLSLALKTKVVEMREKCNYIICCIFGNFSKIKNDKIVTSNFAHTVCAPACVTLDLFSFFNSTRAVYDEPQLGFPTKIAKLDFRENFAKIFAHFRKKISRFTNNFRENGVNIFAKIDQHLNPLTSSYQQITNLVHGWLRSHKADTVS